MRAHRVITRPTELIPVVRVQSSRLQSSFRESIVASNRRKLNGVKVRERRMVNYLLQISAELENIAELQPQEGCDDPSFSFLFKVKCGRCGEVSQKETCVALNEAVPLPVGKGSTHLIQKCKFCGRDGTITMVPGRGKPHTHEASESGKFSPLMLFDCRGYEPLGFVFADGWKAVSLEGTAFDGIDLSSGEFAEYDEKGECPVMISNLRATFDVVK